jgi:hypothetical protein
MTTHTDTLTEEQIITISEQTGRLLQEVNNTVGDNAAYRDAAIEIIFGMGKLIAHIEATKNAGQSAANISQLPNVQKQR